MTVERARWAGAVPEQRSGAGRPSRFGQRRVLRAILVAAAVVQLIVLIASPGRASESAPASETAGARCQEVTIPVGVAPGLPRDQRVSAELCDPPEGRSSELQVLVAGFTYSRTYWDFPVAPERHSYVEHMAERGLSTLSIDRLGTGRSSYPPSALQTLNTHAHVLHEVVGAARDGALPGGGAEQVVTVGHSYGSAVVYHEAALYHDVDAIIPSGATHLISGIGAGQIAASTHPAAADPGSRGSAPPHDPGYVTTRTGTRSMFHSGTVEPAVLDADERTKSTGTLTELATIAQYEADTAAIRVPVLLAVGGQDAVMCRQGARAALADCRDDASLRRSEQAFFPSADQQLAAFVLPGAGHDINLAPNSAEWFDAAARWVRGAVRD